MCILICKSIVSNMALTKNYSQRIKYMKYLTRRSKVISLLSKKNFEPFYMNDLQNLIYGDNDAVYQMKKEINNKITSDSRKQIIENLLRMGQGDVYQLDGIVEAKLSYLDRWSEISSAISLISLVIAFISLVGVTLNYPLLVIVPLLILIIFGILGVILRYVYNKSAKIGYLYQLKSLLSEAKAQFKN